MCLEYNGKRPSKTEPPQTMAIQPNTIQSSLEQKGHQPSRRIKTTINQPVTKQTNLTVLKTKNDAARRETNTTETK